MAYARSVRTDGTGIGGRIISEDLAWRREVERGESFGVAEKMPGSISMRAFENHHNAVDMTYGLGMGASSS